MVIPAHKSAADGAGAFDSVASARWGTAVGSTERSGRQWRQGGEWGTSVCTSGRTERSGVQ